MRKLQCREERLGDKLRALRRGRAVTLEMLETMTHVQKRYLYALEHGAYEVLPEPLYTRNFIRSYAQALHADEAYYLELFDEENGVCDCVSHLRTPLQRLRRIKLYVWNRFVKLGMLTFVALCLMGYLGWQVQSIIDPPNIILLSPLNDSMTSSAVVVVEGYVEEETTVYINGDQVPVASDQTFSAEVDLLKGLNIICIEAERRYSKKASILRNVVFYPENLPQVSFISY